MGLRAKLANVLWRASRFGEARGVLQEALELVDRQHPLQAARLQARLGRVEVEDSVSALSTSTRATICYRAAVAAFDAADELLGDPAELDQEASDVWLEVQVDGRANLHYWWNEPELGAMALTRARWVVEARGSPQRKAGFYAHLAGQQARRNRHRIDEEILANARAAVTAAGQGAGEHAVASSVSSLGCLLLWHGGLAEAQEKLEASLAIGERIGDSLLCLVCHVYLNLAALRRHDVEAVRFLAPMALVAAQAAAYPMFVAVAKASMAWVAWRDERPEDVVALANEALELWQGTVVPYAFTCLCLWPLLAVRLAAGQVDKAVDAGRQLLMPPQIRFPDELESLVQSSLDRWDNGEHERAASDLAEALELAKRLRYA